MKQMKPGTKFCTACGHDQTAVTPDPHHLIPGTKLRDRYTVGNVLGEGGFGITYVGWDSLFDRKVAIKEFYMAGYVSRISTYSPSVQVSMGNYAELFEKTRSRFLDEAKVLARFQSEDGIVGIQDFFQENNTAYIVMDFLDGETLKSYLKRSGKLSWEQARTLMLPVLKSLSKVHAHHIIHRDISPDNIMLTRDGKVKLLDFGAARDYSGGEGKSLSVILKPGFAPEEQYRTKGHQGPWTDVYALCATMYRCLTGITPDESMERVVDDRTKSPAELCGCPKAISDVLMKGLAVLQRDRFQTVDELLTALSAAETVRPIPVPAPKASDADATVFAGNRPTQPADPEATVFSDVAVGSNLDPVSVQHYVPIEESQDVLHSSLESTADYSTASIPRRKTITPTLKVLLTLILTVGILLVLTAFDVVNIFGVEDPQKDVTLEMDTSLDRSDRTDSPEKSIGVPDDSSESEFESAEADPSSDMPTEESETEEPIDKPVEAPAVEEEQDTLVVGYSIFSQKFSPFFATTAYDQDVASFVSLNLLNSDREGSPILNGIEGETRTYNGTDYFYDGIADCEIVENVDGTVDYNFTMREDIVFSDGDPMDIDDVIFSMYVLCDPTYDGLSSLCFAPIVGMEEYRSGMNTKFNLIWATGREGYEATEFFTEEEYNEFWTAVDAAGEAFCQEIVDYCVPYGATTVAKAATLWGYNNLTADATTADFFAVLVDAYGYNLSAETGLNYESGGTPLESFIFAALGSKAAVYQAGVATGESVPNIAGIVKTDDYSMTVTTSISDPFFIYNLDLAICPMHYYGDIDLYDYENNMFGFNKGDLSIIREKTTVPLGAGPYKFVSYENGVVTFEANENYFKGTPKIENVLFQETANADKLTGIASGTFDISDSNLSVSTAKTIGEYNGTGKIIGDVIYTQTVDSLSYDYIGMNANYIKVGEDPSSVESKDLRKAFATLLAVHRDAAVDIYYGSRASVINYPIANASWAVPKPADKDYTVAFSVDVDGNSIYTADMEETAKYAAAIEAARGYLEAAGYTFGADGKATSAPRGAFLTYTATVLADSVGNHSVYGVLTAVKADLEQLGITLEICAVSEWNGPVGLWADSWGTTVNPDMYQRYHSSNVPINYGGTGFNCYNIQDNELDTLIMKTRATADQNYRKAAYKNCLDIIMDWACEVPVCQRQNAIIFSAERVNMATVTPDITTFWGWMNDIELMEMN